MSLHTSIINLTQSNFQQTVEQSISQPVLVYFWSEHHPHCLLLTPILERLVQEYAGQFILAKLDCDAEQLIAAQFDLRAIPTLYLFHHGQPIDGLQGPQNEESLRVLLKNVLPSAEERKTQQAAELMQQGNMLDALPLLKEVWQNDCQTSETGLMLAEVLIALKRSDEAENILQTIPLQDQNTHYQSLIAQIDLLKQASNTPEIQQLQQRLNAEPDNALLATQLALQLHQVGRNEEALQLLFTHLQKDTDTAEGEVRKIFQEILAALGTSDKLATQYRRQLYSLLY